MPEALYERYKEALRRGHVARDHGRWEEAVAAYREAATIAPERALPHAALGAVQLRLGRPEAALAAFAAALERAPEDEGALEGMAEALLALGRRREAADALDRLAAALVRSGRSVAALDAARRALELAESRARRQTLAELTAVIGASPLDEAARAVLARSIGLLERPGPPGEEAHQGRPPVSEGAGRPGGPSGPEGVTAVGPPLAAGVESAGFARGEPAEETGQWVGRDPEELLAAAEAAVAGGRAAEARSGFLAAAAAFRRAGHGAAALDAGLRALALAPDDPQVHLLLAELYVDRGWDALAREKVDLLERLLELDGRPDALAALRVVRGERLGGRGSPRS